MRKFLFVLSIVTAISVTQIFAKENPVDPDSIRYRFAPVVVTGQRYEMPQKDVAASISIISSTEIRQTNLTTVADAISYLSPGVYTTRRSAMGYGVAALAGGSITIRGVGGKPNTQVLMLIDGRPDFQGIFSHPINDAYFLDNVDHIEVLRGPASSVYGTNALGGVVNVITKKLPLSGFNTKFEICYGSYNTQKYRFQHAGNISKFQYFASVGFNQSDGHREQSGFNGQNYALKFNYQFNSHYDITFNGSYTPYEFHDPGPEQGKDYLSGYFDFGDIKRSSLDLTISNNYSETDGTIKIHSNFGDHNLSDGWESNDRTSGIITFQNFYFPSDITSTIGFDVKRFGGTSKSNGTDLGTYFNDEYAFYLYLQKILIKKFILAAGVRLEDNSNFGKEWIPKFGLVYHPFANTSFRASAAKGFRTPSIKDLYLFPPANLNLQPERLWNYEIGLNHSLNKNVSIDLCGFYYEGDQLIETTFNPGINKIQNQNIGSNHARGIEFVVKANPISNLFANLSYSYLDSKEIIPFSPNKFNFLVNYQLSGFDFSFYGEHIENLYTSYELNQFPPKTTIEKISNYTLAHFKIKYKAMENVLIGVGVENIFGQSYQILKGYPMPGRTIFSNLMLSF